MNIVTLIIAALWVVALAALFAATARDLKDRLIPNVLVLVVLSAAFGLRILSGFSLFGLSVFATAIVTLLVYALADRELMGWGDAKMIAAVSFLVPPQEVLALVVYIAVAGGALSCFYLLARVVVKRGAFARYATAGAPSEVSSFDELMRSEAARISAHEPMPYAFAIAGGLLYWLLMQVTQCYYATHCLY